MEIRDEDAWEAALEREAEAKQDLRKARIEMEKKYG